MPSSQHPRTGRRRVAALLSGVVCALPTACGEAPPSGRALRRAIEGEFRSALEETLPAAGEAAAAATTAFHLDVPEDADEGSTWTTGTASRIGSHEAAPGRRCYFVLGKGTREVRIPGPFDPSAFNLVRLELLVRIRSTLELVLRDGNGAQLSSGPVPLRNLPVPQTVVGRFDRNGDRVEPWDELVIRISDAAGPVGLLSVSGEAVSARDWLCGAVDHTADRTGVTIGEEWRELAGLVLEGESLRCELSVPGEGALLELAVAPGPGWQVAEGAAARVHLRTPEGTGESAAEPALALPLESRSWSGELLDLGPWSGRRVSLEIGVEGVPGAYVAAPRAIPMATAPGPAPPTVLFITSDTHRADHLGVASGAAPVSTPALDALAARGVRFERAWSTAEVTLPSHVALMTGLHPRDTGVFSNAELLSDRASTLAEAFHAEGWRTFAAVSARHLGQETSGLGQGFERISSPRGERSATATVDELLGWLGAAEREPLFAWLHVFDAHAPYAPPEEYVAAEMARPEASAEGDRFARGKARYRAEVRYLDTELGRLLEHPRFADATIAFTSDHGESLGTNGLVFTHEELYPAMLHVPLILSWPGGPSGETVGTPLTHSHVAHTLLALAGLPAGDFPGEDLRRYLGAGAPVEAPRFAISARASSASLTQGDSHLVLHLVAHPIGRPTPVRTVDAHQVELYDLATDPDCERDLVNERADEARRLRIALGRWLTSAQGDLVAGSLDDAEHLAELAAMGYSEGGDRLSLELPDEACDCEWCVRYAR